MYGHADQSTAGTASLLRLKLLCDGASFLAMYVMTAISRQMEAMGQLGWRKPTFDEYANYLYKKLQVYTAVAAEKGRSGQFPICCHNLLSRC
jgi:hypothetical protein